jgi:hypothetical protein
MTSSAESLRCERGFRRMNRRPLFEPPPPPPPAEEDLDLDRDLGDYQFDADEAPYMREDVGE